MAVNEFSRLSKLRSVLSIENVWPFIALPSSIFFLNAFARPFLPALPRLAAAQSTALLCRRPSPLSYQAMPVLPLPLPCIF